MYGIGKIFDTKYGGLIFSLLCGMAYFIIILSFILKNTAQAGLLAFFFAPAIIAGIALIIIKNVRRFAEEEKFKSVNMFLYPQIVIMILSIFFLIDLLK
jgi:biotin transporter BioY